MDPILFEPLQLETLNGVFFNRNEQAGRATLEALAQMLEGVDDSCSAVERISEFHLSLPESERAWVSHGMSLLALSKDHRLVSIGVSAAGCLVLLDCLPALSLAIESYPRKLGAALKKHIGHISKQLQDTLRALPPRERMMLEMDNILRQGVFQYEDTQAQVVHAVRWLADYFEMVQRLRQDFSVCRDWALHHLENDEQIGQLASLELCAIFRIREAAPLIIYLSKQPGFSEPDTHEHRTLTLAADQLHISLS